MNVILVFLQSAILQGTPLLYGATGEILTEKSGNLNLGIPGIMYVGAISGVMGGFFYQSSVSRVNTFLAILIPMLCCLIGSLAIAKIEWSNWIKFMWKFLGILMIGAVITILIAVAIGF